MKLAEKFKQVLLESGLINKSKLDAYGIDVTLEKVMGEDAKGVLLGFTRYSAMYEVEKFDGESEDISALIFLFLDDADEWRDEYDIADPDIDITDEAGNTVSLSIKIPFYEPVYMHRSPTGHLTYNGELYAMGTGEADSAESLSGIEAGVE